MSEQIGTKIREARNNAGMSQEKLAKAADGVSVSDISKAERGLKELTPEQLHSIEAATGAVPGSLTDAGEVVPAPVEDASADAKDVVSAETNEETALNTPITVTLTSAEKELLDAYKAAAFWKQKAVLFLLKGEKPQMPEIMALLSGMMAKGSGENGASPLAGVMSSIKGMIDSSKSNAEGGKKSNGASGYLMSFTYLYSVTIYVFLLSFYFWLQRTDIKPEKPAMS